MRGKVPEPVTNPIKVGYWENETDVPVNMGWRVSNGNLILSVSKYLEDWDTVCERKQKSTCLICGATVGLSEYTKDNFQYPASYLHYIWSHHAVPDDRIVTAAKEEGY